MIDLILKNLRKASGLTTAKVGLLQTKAYRILKQETSKVLVPYKITSIDWALLGLIYDEDSIRLSDLADELGVEAPFITERIASLTKMGLVEVVISATDKRAKTVNLTTGAKKLIPKIEKEIIKKMVPLVKGVKIADLKGYKHTLEAIIKNKPL